MHGCIWESNWNKYLALFLTDESKDKKSMEISGTK